MFRMGSDSQKDIDRDQKMYRCIDGGMWNVECGMGGGKVVASKSDDWKFIIIVHKLIRKLISCIVGIVVVLKYKNT